MTILFNVFLLVVFSLSMAHYSKAEEIYRGQESSETITESTSEKEGLEARLQTQSTSSQEIEKTQASKDGQVYDAEKITDIFYALFGDPKDPHKKINHTKGFCASGEFIPAKGISNGIDIPLLREKRLEATLRYSIGGGDPRASDKTKTRGLAIKLSGSKDAWEIVALNTEINFARDAREFGQFFEMMVPKNGIVDTALIKRRTNEVASYRNFAKYVDELGISDSVANTAFHSVHTFFFRDSRGNMTPARFRLAPEAAAVYLDKYELKRLGDEFLEADFKKKVAKAPITYRLILIFANENDAVNDTTALWHGKHDELEIGALRVMDYDGAECNLNVFMPSVLPEGVGEPIDPLFRVRNETYAVSFGRRQ